MAREVSVNKDNFIDVNFEECTGSFLMVHGNCVSEGCYAHDRGKYCALFRE
jgi:murein L,D-transpeptidase YafK